MATKVHKRRLPATSEQLPPDAADDELILPTINQQMKRIRRLNKLDMLRFAIILEAFLLLVQVLCAQETSNYITKPLISIASAATPDFLQDTSNQEGSNQKEHSMAASSLAASPSAVTHESLESDELANKNLQTTTNEEIFNNQTQKQTHSKSAGETSTGSQVVSTNSNYLLADDSDVNQYPEMMLLRADDDINSILDEADPPIERPIKSKRQTDQKSTSANWWTTISKPSKKPSQARDKTSKKRPTVQNEPAPEASKTRPPATKKGVKAEPVTKRPPVYREQPMNQNSILTIRKQLVAIRGQHKLLVTRSMRQLQQLDNRLIDSYKLCLKRKQPLYAGMLYRTRDFVVRMAKEVKHERKVLEAMTKQVQDVLRQKMTNTTLVAEYNKLLATTTSTESSAASQQTISIEEVSIQSEQRRVSVKAHRTTRLSLPRAKKDIKSRAGDSQQQQVSDKSLTQDRLSLDDETIDFPSHERGKKSSNPQKHVNATTSTSNSKQSKQNFDASQKLATKRREIEQLTTKKPKSVKYTVSVNEANLKKELNKVQDLIDRVNGSCHELTSVVDDIGHLFRLSLEYPSKQKGAGKINKLDKTVAYGEDATYPGSEHKRSKKIFKSPIKIFMEKYGKLTMANFDNAPNNKFSDTLPANLPELKPLFESSSLVYTEAADPDFGFDYVMPHNTE